MIACRFLLHIPKLLLTIGNEGAKALAANSQLTTLKVVFNDITNEGAKALATNRCLKTLNLASNYIESEGAKAFADNKSLTSLDLRSISSCDDLLAELAKNTHLIKLKLSTKNYRSSDGLKALHNMLTRNKHYLLIKERASLLWTAMSDSSSSFK